MLTQWKNRIGRRYCGKYEYLLLYDKIRLSEVPESIRLNVNYASILHIAALRTSRAISPERFAVDLYFLAHEIEGLADGDPVKADLAFRLAEYSKMLENMLKKSISKGGTTPHDRL